MAYTTLAEVRAVPGLEDASAYSDELLTECIDRAEELILDYCGPWAPVTITRLLAGGTGRILSTGIPAIRSISSATFDDEAQDVSGWTWDYFGDITLPASVNVRSVSLTVTAGLQDTPPARLAWAARRLAGAYALEAESAVPERALSVQSEVGQIMLAQPGGTGRPTAYPEVNAVLNRFRTSWGIA